MSIATSLVQVVSRLMFERPVQALSLADIVVQLEISGGKLLSQLATSRDTPANRELVCHIVGIERWSQRRLHVALGAAPVQDEYDGYRPSQTLSWDDLHATFAAARQESIALGNQLHANDVDPNMIVRHNDLGLLSVRGWLRYMSLHASLEAKALK
ncbi:MAG: hypothetical protein HC837_06110 [Chloroflexaceae bacterium]|nr:hypothetical protein [Chloroflexaceae bacterium]